MRQPFPSGSGLPASLGDRLRAAYVDASAEPRYAWLRLRESEGRRATVVDLYELVACQRGLTADQLQREERTELTQWALPYIWPGFSRTEGSERADFDLTVVTYDPAWPARYEAWHERLDAALADVALRIEHVGSTAVPNLAAKPTVDIQVSVAGLDDETRYVPAVESTGLLLRGRDSVHRFFRPPADQSRDVHVHVCEQGSEWEREHLLFRDYLRSNSAAREIYAAVKRELATRWSDDRIAYTEAKTATVLELLDQAEEWSERAGWSL